MFHQRFCILFILKDHQTSAESINIVGLFPHPGEHVSPYHESRLDQGTGYACLPHFQRNTLFQWGCGHEPGTRTGHVRGGEYFFDQPIRHTEIQQFVLPEQTPIKTSPRMMKIRFKPAVNIMKRILNGR
jgi:hypothetical protein